MMISHKALQTGFLSLFLLFAMAVPPALGQNYLTTRPHRGDGIYSLLRKYNLPTNDTYLNEFIRLNAAFLKGGRELLLGHHYKLPVYRFTYNGTSIRSTIGISDYALAREIQKYNDDLYYKGIRTRRYTADKDLWVPFTYMAAPSRPPADFTVPLFGRRYQSVNMVDASLAGCVFYLVSGHGGPDPGAVGKRGTYRLYEDEYAYDITLRLAKNLMERSAQVYMIVQDPDDGIRDEQILKGDKDERYYGGVAIHRHRLRRLDKRAEIINGLYESHKGRSHKQYTVILHVDSRSNSKRIDVFYYYQKSNAASRELALVLYRTFQRKYTEKQPGRGYRGTVTARDLHMLRQTESTSVYIELGNIRNQLDQDRFILENNRQALANWLCEGLIEACSEGETEIISHGIHLFRD
jgi:N-acetylmuramoyl-L-alanine amidase